MHAWVELDERGQQFLVRQGTGTVTAVAACGPDGNAYRVEIACDVPPGWSRAIRYTVQAQVADTHPLLPAAMAAEDSGARVAWAVTWHRHEDVPGDLPITSLDLTTDAVSRLTELHVVEQAVPTSLATSTVRDAEEP